ncbi:unnamed protein product [Linum trigynum]|uniref:Uncharacterized protein n=1 Tax=Linum trigynum TaxID=586398 RepID=A0AAV2FFL9_9ROSI
MRRVEAQVAEAEAEQRWRLEAAELKGGETERWWPTCEDDSLRRRPGARRRRTLAWRYRSAAGEGDDCAAGNGMRCMFVGFWFPDDQTHASPYRFVQQANTKQNGAASPPRLLSAQSAETATQRPKRGSGRATR